MPSPARHTVVIIGCGNVAWHLAKRLTESKACSVSVYNHRPNPALKQFATKLKCPVFSDLKNINPGADYYFICVGDQFISSVSKKVKCDRPGAVIVHTSGSMELSEIKNPQIHKAVFYPLQSFSAKDEIDWDKVPLILESSSPTAIKNVDLLAKKMGGPVAFLSYKERLRLHLGAVLVNNFTNALYTAAWDLVNEKGKHNSFELLLPLIEKTAAKVQSLEPRAAQTGPAKRGDKKVQKKHLNLLKGDRALKKLYKEISQLIITQQNRYA